MYFLLGEIPFALPGTPSDPLIQNRIDLLFDVISHHDRRRRQLERELGE